MASKAVILANRANAALKPLRSAWTRVKVISCSDGSVVIKPRWRHSYRAPGVLTRMFVANQLQVFLNGRLRNARSSR